MERRSPIDLDLAEANAVIQQRWFVWTAAGLDVQPISWTGEQGTRPDRARALHLRVTRPNASVDVAVRTDGWTDMTVLRPGADAVVRTRVQVGSVGAFGELLDRVIELITWSGLPKESPAPTAHPQRTEDWVVGYDGNPWSSG